MLLQFAYYSSRLPPPKPGSFLPSYTYTNPWFLLVSRLGLSAWGKSSDRPNLSTSCCLPVSRHQQRQAGKPKTWWGELIQLPSAICEAACAAFKAACQGKAASVQPLLMAWLSWQHFNWKKIHICFSTLSFMKVYSTSPARWAPPRWTCAPTSCWDKVSDIHSPSQAMERQLLLSYTKYSTKQSWEVHLSSLFVSIASSPSHREHSSWHHLPQQ